MAQGVPAAYQKIGGGNEVDSTDNTHNSRDERKRKCKELILSRIYGLVAKFESEGYPKRQVTLGYIARVVGSTWAKFQRYKVQPEVSVLLNSLIESKDDWLRRRTIEICQEKISLAKPTTIKTIKKSMGLCPDTFIKYESFLQEVIDEVYVKFDN